jgi:hypothetical protein
MTARDTPPKSAGGCGGADGMYRLFRVVDAEDEDDELGGAVFLGMTVSVINMCAAKTLLVTDRARRR